MKKPTLVIMAAGMGSRFGGLKQMTPVDPQGHFLMDFSIYDALRAGFGRVVCIIKPEMQADFEARIGTRVRGHIELLYAHQTLDQLPAGFSLPAGRVKPWGTTHAVLCAAPLLDGPFAVINADDFYGAEAFAAMAAFLQAGHGPTEHAMVGYALGNTLTAFGSVSRGVCTVDAQGHLTSVHEHKRIFLRPDGPAYTEDGTVFSPLSPADLVSMNLWGFQPEILPYFAETFQAFLSGLTEETAATGESLISHLIDGMIAAGRGSVTVLSTGARWHGVTYREDLPGVTAAIAAEKAAGRYPETLWENS